MNRPKIRTILLEELNREDVYKNPVKPKDIAKKYNLNEDDVTDVLCELEREGKCAVE